MLGRIGLAVLAVALGSAGAVAQTPAAPSSTEAIQQLAPSGRLRVAINLGNAVLAQGTPQVPRGVSVDLARELARRTGLSLELVPFEAAGKVFEALKANAWDVAFFAIEPARAAEVDFTTPYVLIEGTYMVRNESPLRTIEDVDKPGIKIAVGRGSAYDLYLTRSLKSAELVRAQTGGNRAMIDLFMTEKLDVVAGVRQQLQAYAKTDPSMRIMDGRFQVIRQAMGTPKGRPLASAYLKSFVEDVKALGFVAEGLKRSGQTDAQVAPAGE